MPYFVLALKEIGLKRAYFMRYVRSTLLNLRLFGEHTMLKINRKVEYALMALKFMMSKGPGELASAREIGDHFGIPFDTVSKVMQTLRKNALLQSVKGVGGGHRLVADLSGISYMQLARMVEERPMTGPCHTEKGQCEHFGSCNIITPIDTVNQRVTEFLEGVTVRDLLTDRLDLTRQVLSMDGVRKDKVL